jgi:hypothetical protein
MIFTKAPNQIEIIKLLSRLKAETPDYQSDLMAARKAAFISQAVAIKYGGPKQGGKGGGDGGSSTSIGPGGSRALGGMSTAQGILLQAVIGVWIVAAMLATAYVLRDQIIDLLLDNGIVVEMTQAPSIESTDPSFVTPAAESPSPDVPPTEVTPPTATPAPDASSEGEVSPESSSEGQDISENPDDTKDNQGLHLGQTPGAPNVPNQDKPDKPEKPDKSNKPDKTK